jgi:ABC-type uncharacterized transport system substrate-binding protein
LTGTGRLLTGTLRAFRAGLAPGRRGAALCALALLLSVLVLHPHTSPEAAPPLQAATRPPVLILSSLRIRPYESLADTMRLALKGYDTKVLYLDENPDAAQQISTMAPAAIVTVGQDALKKALPLRGSSPLVYTMVLFPHEILATPAPPGISGIAMLPSPKQQLLVLDQGFHLRRLVLFYNPKVTGPLVGHYQASTPSGMTLKAVQVASDAELLEKLPEELESADGLLLVPDPTVLTEQGLKSLIGACYSSNIPVVGFSPMYLDIGAALSLSVPAEEVARQAAAIAASRGGIPGDLLDDVYYVKSCQIDLSGKAVTRLGMKVDREALKPLGTLLWSGG